MCVCVCIYVCVRCVVIEEGRNRAGQGSQGCCYEPDSLQLTRLPTRRWRTRPYRVPLFILDIWFSRKFLCLFLYLKLVHYEIDPFRVDYTYLRDPYPSSSSTTTLLLYTSVWVLETGSLRFCLSKNLGRRRRVGRQLGSERVVSLRAVYI